MKRVGALFGLYLACNPLMVAQQPFELDTTFRAGFETWYVASALPMADGKVLVSGQIHEIDEPFPFTFQSVVRLNANGTWDDSFLQGVPGGALPGGGKLTHWIDRFYVGTAQTVKRILYTPQVDPSFIPMNTGPYFSSLQGGDYHVFPDGRLVMSGSHLLSDEVRGFVGTYNFIWFSNEGYLDTTRIHRKGNGALYDFLELPDGKFIAGGLCTVYDGQPTSYIQRMNADGSLDTSFFTNTIWGEANAFLPMPDGRVYAGGYFTIGSDPDTLNLVRFLPDGTLDPTFNNYLQFTKGDLDGLAPIVFDLYPLAADRILVLGRFVTVAGQEHYGLAVVDSSGVLVELGTGTGCGPTTYQGYTSRTPLGAVAYGTDQLLVFGNYHGYDDGVINDTLQRFVSRLNIGSLYVGEAERQLQPTSVSAYPNPTTGELVVETDLVPNEQHIIVLRNVVGNMVLQQRTNSTKTFLNLNPLANGIYQLEVHARDGLVAVQRIVVQH